MPSNLHVTTAMVWACTSILFVLDGLLAILVGHSVNRRQFYKLRYKLSLVSGVFFLLVWASVMLWAWDWFYVYIFPSWARFALPLLFTVGYGLLALGMGWLSLKLPFNPAVTWCILGGLEGLLSHLYAIYGLGAASKPPIIQGVDPFAVLIFAIFEKAFYWSLILLGCLLVSQWSHRKMVKI
ncbi:MAG TPA: hypothetical protein VLD65_11730 [Anaerolineales bacterium]|nr:hypothetical protein [Anaerolineales bacterium]